MGLFDMFVKKSSSQPQQRPVALTPAGAPAVDSYAFHGSTYDYFTALLQGCFGDYELGWGVSPLYILPRTAAKSEWICSCGAANSSKFCSECGKPKPESSEWTCRCGSSNKGKFCPECGQKKPETQQSAFSEILADNQYVNLSFVLRKDGVPKLAILLCDKKKWNTREIRNTMTACQSAGLPCLRFMSQFRNNAGYVVNRIRKALR